MTLNHIPAKKVGCRQQKVLHQVIFLSPKQNKAYLISTSIYMLYSGVVSRFVLFEEVVGGGKPTQRFAGISLILKRPDESPSLHRFQAQAQVQPGSSWLCLPICSCALGAQGDGGRAAECTRGWEYGTSYPSRCTAYTCSNCRRFVPLRGRIERIQLN